MREGEGDRERYHDVEPQGEVEATLCCGASRAQLSHGKWDA